MYRRGWSGKQSLQRHCRSFMSSATTKSWRRPAGAGIAKKSRDLQLPRRLGHIRKLMNTSCISLRVQQNNLVNSIWTFCKFKRSRRPKLWMARTHPAWKFRPSDQCICAKRAPRKVQHASASSYNASEGAISGIGRREHCARHVFWGVR